MNKQIISSVIIAVGLCASGLLIGMSVLKYSDANRFVTVKGYAEKQVKSDTGIWTLAYSFAEDDMAKLYDGINSTQKIITDFLAQQGFTADEIETQPMQVYDNMSVSPSNGKRYIANANVVLTTKKIDLLKDSTQKTNVLIQQGVVLGFPQLSYIFTDINELKPKLLDDATTNAKISADAFAKNAGSKVGAIRQATQGLVTVGDSKDQNYGASDLMKKVRVVVTVQYFIK